MGASLFPVSLVRSLPLIHLQSTNITWKISEIASPTFQVRRRPELAEEIEFPLGSAGYWLTTLLYRLFTLNATTGSLTVNSPLGFHTINLNPDNPYPIY